MGGKKSQMKVFIERSVDPQVLVEAEHKGTKAKRTDSKTPLKVCLRSHLS